MRNLSRQDGFTITEMMVSTAVILMVLAGALTTFRNALAINDSAAQLADANQNLRAGTTTLSRDLLMAGRLIGTEGISMPTGPGVTFARPGPVAMNF
ncbi:MAG: PilW family protein, partial [Vicinamibacterales bacterium]